MLNQARLKDGTPSATVLASSSAESAAAFEPALCEHRTVLNLGCGRKHRPDAINLDVTGDTAPDIVHDLNQVPWPFPDDRFTEVLVVTTKAGEQCRHVCVVE